MLIKKIEKLQILLKEKFLSLYIALFAITESIFNPIPVEVILIPTVIRFPQKFIFLALLAAFMSTAGGLIAYVIGYYAEELLLNKIINLNDFEAIYNKYGLWVILVGAMTPFPFKVVTIASGVFGLNIYYFIGFCFLGRYVRYQCVTLLTYIIGPTIVRSIDKLNKKIPIFKKLLYISIVLFILIMIFMA